MCSQLTHPYIARLLLCITISFTCTVCIYKSSIHMPTMYSYGITQMQRCTCSTTFCLLYAQIRRLPSRVYKLATQKLLYTWLTIKLL